jgi:signal transduction histidine kinase
MVFDDDPGTSAELVGALSAHGYRATQAGLTTGAADALKQGRPDVAVLTDRAFEVPGAGLGGLRRAADELGVPFLVVVGESADPLALANRLAEADDWVGRRVLDPELPARVARLLKRREASLAVMAGPADPQFFALVVHDLRSPLNVIGLSLRMIQQSVPKGDPELEEDLRYVSENFYLIERMLAQLSDYYRLFDAESQLTLAPFSPRRMVDELIAFVSARSRGKASPFRVDVRPTCPGEVHLDLLRAQQAIRYALANASAASNGTPVRLTMGGGPNRWVVEVAIDQPPPETVTSVTLAPRSFERLCGFAAERRGMDLAIAAKVSELFGGSARLDVVEGQGTTIVLDWPARLEGD